jgi:hypothetical protein
MVGNLATRAFGGAKESQPAKPIDWKNWGNLTTGTVLLTSGIAAGVVGGVVLGGGAAAAGSILHGLVSHGFNAAALSGAGSAALVTGAVAAPIAGFVGAKGGATLTKFAARNIIDPATHAVKEALAKKPEETSKKEPDETKMDWTNPSHLGWGLLGAVPLIGAVVGIETYVPSDASKSEKWCHAGSIAANLASVGALATGHWVLGAGLATAAGAMFAPIAVKEQI